MKLKTYFTRFYKIFHYTRITTQKSSTTKSTQCFHYKILFNTKTYKIYIFLFYFLNVSHQAHNTVELN